MSETIILRLPVGLTHEQREYALACASMFARHYPYQPPGVRSGAIYKRGGVTFNAYWTPARAVVVRAAIAATNPTQGDGGES